MEAKSSVFWRLLASWMASCSSSGCRGKARGRFLAYVHDVKNGLLPCWPQGRGAQAKKASALAGNPTIVAEKGRGLYHRPGPANDPIIVAETRAGMRGGST